MALRQFCLHVLHMWKDNDQVDARLRQRPSGCSTTTKWMLALLCSSLLEGLYVSKTMMACLASFLGVSPFRETQDPMVDARLDFLYRNAGAMEKLNEVIDKVHKALQEVRCAHDACLEHQVSTQERRGRRGCRQCRGQRSSSAPPRPPHHGRQ